MSLTATIYFLVLIAGGARLEVISKPPLTLEQCYKAGAEWTAKARNHKYECKRIKP